MKQKYGKQFAFLGPRASPVSPQQIQSFDEETEEIPLQTNNQTRSDSKVSIFFKITTME